MRDEAQNNAFRTAYDKASSELLKITQEFEQLRLQREQVEKVVNVLKPAVGLDANPGTGHQTPAAQRKGFTVLTHISIVRMPR